MATRIPYTASDDDIYSQLMAQFAQAQPYYSAAPVDYASGLLGGYDTSMYAPTAAATAAPAAATVSRPYYGGVDYGFGPVTAGSPGDGSVPFDTMTPAEQAEFYAANPTFAAITQGLQGLFGMTSLGMLQNAMVPDFVQAQSEIAHGIVPGSVNSISAQNAMDVGAHPGLGFGSGIQQANAGNQSLTGGLLDFSGQQAPATVTDLSTLSNELAAQQMAAEINASLEAAGAPAAAEASLGNDTVGFGSYGETGGIVGADSGGGGDGGGGATVICTKLHSLGKMPEDIFEADQAFGEMMIRLHPEIYAGYILWAKHVVRWMGRDDFIGKAVVAIVETLAKPWSIAMAEEMGVNVKSSWFGRLLLKRGMQICKFIGGMTKKEGLQNV